MSKDAARSTDDELRALLASYEASPSIESDVRLAASMRELALADVDAYTRAMLALESVPTRSDAVEPLLCEDHFDVRFEPIVEAYADLLDVDLAAHADPRSDVAYQAALGYLVLGDLASAKSRPEILGRLRPRAERLIRHRHPDVRALGLTLVADMAEASDVRTRGALSELLTSDPDPVVRDAAFSELEFLKALPPGARKPVLPTWFRGLRRCLAGG